MLTYGTSLIFCDFLGSRIEAGGSRNPNISRDHADIKRYLDVFRNFSRNQAICSRYWDSCGHAPVQRCRKRLPQVTPGRQGTTRLRNSPHHPRQHSGDTTNAGTLSGYRHLQRAIARTSKLNAWRTAERDELCADQPSCARRHGSRESGSQPSSARCGSHRGQQR